MCLDMSFESYNVQKPLGLDGLWMRLYDAGKWSISVGKAEQTNKRKGNNKFDVFDYYSQ